MNIFILNQQIGYTTQRETIQKIFHTYEQFNVIKFDSITDEDEGIFYFAGLEMDQIPEYETIKKVKNRGLIIMQENYCIHTCSWMINTLKKLKELFSDDKVLFIVQCKKDQEVVKDIFPNALIGIRNFWLDEFFHQEYIPKRFDLKGKESFSDIENKLFSVFARRFDYVRLDFFSQLLYNDLLKDFHFSFSDFLGGEDRENHADIKNYVEHSDTIMNKEQVHEWLKNFPYELADTSDFEIKCAYPDILEYYYNKSKINIIFESQPNHSFYQSISEKTYKAFFYKKPFFLICHPYQLKALRMEGYRTFHEVFDESYDEMENYQDRIDCIINEMKRLQKLSEFEMNQIIDHCKDIVEHNYNTLVDNIHTNNIDPSITIDKVIKNMKSV